MNNSAEKKREKKKKFPMVSAIWFITIKPVII